MDGVRELYLDLFKQAQASEEVGFVKEALGPLGKALALSGAGLGGGLIGLAAGKHSARRAAEEEAARQKALTFGAGTLAGLVTPTLLKKLKGAAGMGVSPGDAYYDEFTEF